jgi:hypothetical protein
MRTDERSFASFLQQHSNELGAIARWSRGRLTLDDIHNEAWVQAFELGDARARSLDLEDAADASLLLACLRRHFDREHRLLRSGRSLDQSLDGFDGPAYADLLAIDDGAHPLSLLEALEDEVPGQELPGPHHSEIAAWHWLALRFNRRTADLAAYLLISASWCGARRRRARGRAGAQWPLPNGLRPDGGDADDMLRPWRRFKLPPRQRPAPRQLHFDYWNRPTQPACGQLWLL